MQQRLHHLDAARAVLLLLGIPFHVGTTATMILSPGFPAWMANPVLGVGLSFIHSFRMSAFFILAGYFSGVVQAPMTAFVIILEMTGNHDNVIALMAASVLGYGTARLITREPLYHALSRLFIADVLRQRRAQSAGAAP